MATRVIGLDIGSKFVRGVILESKGRSFALVELIEEAIEAPVPATEEAATNPASDTQGAPASADTSADDALHDDASHTPPVDEETTDPRLWSDSVEEAVRRILDRPEIEEYAVITAAPEGSFMMTAIELPFSGDREIRAVLAPQLDGRLPSDVEDLHLDHMVSGKTNEGQTRIFAGGIPQEQMALLMSHWSDVAVDPRIIDVMPFPLFTAGEWLHSSEEKSIAYVDMGANFTRIVIAHNQLAEVTRTIPGGGEAMATAIARSLNLSDEAARERQFAHKQFDLQDDDPDTQRINDALRAGLRPIIRDLRRTLAAHAATHGRSVEHVYLSGGSFNMQGLQDYVAAELGITAETLTFNRAEVNTIPGAKALSHRFITALGLALRGVNVTPASDFDLRHGAWAFRGAYEYITQRIPALAMMFVGILSAFIFYMGARNSLLKAEYQAADDGLAAISRQVFGSELRDPELVRSRLSRGVDGVGLHPSVSAYDMIVRVSQAAQATVDARSPVELTDIDVDMSRRQIRLSGVCDSANAAETFGQNLAKDNCIRQVQRSNLTQRRSDSKFEFSYTTVVNCSAPPTAETADASEDAAEEVEP